LDGEDKQISGKKKIFRSYYTSEKWRFVFVAGKRRLKTPDSLYFVPFPFTSNNTRTHARFYTGIRFTKNPVFKHESQNNY